MNYLDFEQPIAELEQKIEELRRMGAGEDINIHEEVSRLEVKCQSLTKNIFSSLSAQQIVQLARHPLRPHTSDYIKRLFTDFDELHGDRNSSKGPAIMGGIARFNGEPVMIIGHEKGRTTKDKVARNFGMGSPDGFRKAKRLMELADKFKLPILTFIDTPGASPGIQAEERNQSEAIARNLLVMSQLKVPIICTIIGEGCSGGALAIGVGDRTVMLNYSYYSVISPEGCASILWKSADKAGEAAEALNLTAPRLHSLGLVDDVITEPLGGAHRDIDQIAASVKTVLERELAVLKELSAEELVAQRTQRYMDFGRVDK